MVGKRSTVRIIDLSKMFIGKKEGFVVEKFIFPTQNRGSISKPLATFRTRQEAESFAKGVLRGL